jgi:hypothetical protein
VTRVLQQRWVRVGLLALAIFVVNAVSRFVTWKFHVVDESNQTKLDVVLIGVLMLVVVGATAWWSIRYPFPRVFFDIGAAILVGVLACLLLAPFAGGVKPFTEGIGVFLAEFVVFVGVAAAGGFLSFFAVVAFGRDWKSRGLRRYEQDYLKRPHRTVRG